MRVQCITPFITKPYNDIYCKLKNNSPTFKGSQALSGVINGQLPLANSLRNFTIKEYKHMQGFEIDAINRMINRDFLTKNGFSVKFFDFLDFHNIAATGIKKALENNYGAGNFVVITIGRSLSSIGKCLGYMIGENNVKQLPMSQAARFIDISNRKEELTGLQKYLTSIGLSKDEIKKSGKKYIFTDFCATGASLLGTKRLFTSENMYGDLYNIEFINVHNLLSGIIPEDMLGKLDDSFLRCDFKNYSLVKRCCLLSDTINAIIKPKDYTLEAKCFYFKLLDNEMQKNKNIFFT